MTQLYGKLGAKSHLGFARREHRAGACGQRDPGVQQVPSPAPCVGDANAPAATECSLEDEPVFVDDECRPSFTLPRQAELPTTGR